MKKGVSKNNLLTRRIHTRITGEKYDELTSILRRSRGIRSHSELLRIILNNQKVQLSYYDATYDKLIDEISSIRTQLRGIGVNLNQVTREIHLSKLEGDIQVSVQELVGLAKQSDLKMAELLSILTKLSEQWLPE